MRIYIGWTHWLSEQHTKRPTGPKCTASQTKHFCQNSKSKPDQTFRSNDKFTGNPGDSAMYNQLIPDCGKFCRTNNFFFNKQEPSKQKQSEKIVND